MAKKVEPLHSWGEYFIAKEQVRQMNIIYLCDDLSEDDVLALKELSERVSLWEVTKNM